MREEDFSLHKEPPPTSRQQTRRRDFKSLTGLFGEFQKKSKNS